MRPPAPLRTVSGRQRLRLVIPLVGVGVVLVGLLAGMMATGACALTQKRVEEHNVVFVKTPKCASSTAGGVVRRVAWKHGLSGYGDLEWIEKEPGVWANHLPREHLDVDALKKPSVLITTVRDPVERCFSAFFHFHVSRPITFAIEKGRPLTQQQIDALYKPENKYRVLLHCTDTMTVVARRHRGQMPRDIVRDFDLIIPSERSVEGFLMMGYILTASISDLLFLSSKNSTTTHTVAHAPLDNEPPEIQRFVKGEFRRLNSLDFQLVRLARQQLQEKIDAVPSFGNNLRLYRKLLQRVSSECADQGDSNCLWNDNGCGQSCIDKVVATDPERDLAETRLGNL